jgi:hypothetical protein
MEMKNRLLTSKHIKPTQGFSDATYSVSTNKTLGLTNNTFKEIIKHYFNRFIKPNSKYFLLVRFKYASGSIETLHKGIVVSIILLDAYLKYCENVLSIKSNNYTDEPVIEVVFNFFLINRDREKYYIDRWFEMKEIVPAKLEKFDISLGSHYFLPPNQDYTE